MTKILLLMIAGVSMGAGAATSLHPADAYDIKQSAEFAVMNQSIKAGEPKKVSGGYEVPVAVNGNTCKVLVKPYTPSQIEPPIRWKAAGQPVCNK